MANTGGEAGLFRALQEVEASKPDVVLLQEIAQSAKGCQDLTLQAARSGYAAYALEGYTYQGRWGHQIQKGGAAILVKKTLNHLPGAQSRLRRATALTIRIGDHIVGTGYAPPQDEALEDFAQIIAEISQAESWQAGGAQKWCFAGDFNVEAEVADKAPAYAHIRAAGGWLHRVGAPTRWRGGREIDWICANTGLAAPVEVQDTWVSDHKVLAWSLQAVAARTNTVKLVQRPRWTKPTGVDTKTWRAMLEAEEAAAKKEGRLDQLDDKLCSPTIDVEEELEAWTACLNAQFRGAYTKLQARAEEAGEDALKMELKRSTAAKRNKGGRAEFTTCYGGGGKIPEPAQRQRKRRRWLARAHTLLGRTACGGHGKQEHQKESERRLQQRVRRRLKPGLEEEVGLTEAVRRTITATHRAMGQDEAQAKAAKIEEWRGRMRQGLTQVASWLKSKTDIPTPTIVRQAGGDTQTAESREEACSWIADHWKAVWREGALAPQEVQERAAYLIHHIEKPFVRWRRPQDDEMLNAFRRAKGSCSPDGWLGQELKHISQGMAARFNTVVSRWEKAGKVPREIKQARQINLPKPKKVKGGKTAAGDTRPISVFSVLWRVYAAAWMATPGWRSWTRQAFPREGATIGGKYATGAEEAAADLYQEMLERGFGATVDYSQCFDRVNAAVTVEAMRGLGFPGGLCATLGEVWQNQERFLTWDQHTHREALEASCLPQGDPISPFALGIWMISGSAAVQEQLDEEFPTAAPTGRGKRRRRRAGRIAKNYMDDRSWADECPRRLVGAVTAWHGWSSRVGLKENEEKTQLAAFGADNRRRLQEAATEAGLEDKIVEEIEILGVGFSKRVGDREEKRLKAAEHAAQLLKVIPGSRATKLGHARALAVSKAVYGWCGKRPARSRVAAANRTIKKVTKTSRAANKWLTHILEGGTTELQDVIGQRQAALAFRRWRRAPLPATDPLLNAVHYNLKDMGYTKEATGVWRHAQPELDIDFVARARAAEDQEVEGSSDTESTTDYVDSEPSDREEKEEAEERRQQADEEEEEEEEEEEAQAAARAALAKEDKRLGRSRAATAAQRRTITHRLREARRLQAWGRFKAQDRTVAQLAPTTYPAKQAAKARALLKVADEGAIRCLAVGGVLSPACMQDQGQEMLLCCWCHAHLGHWDHICWECEARPSTWEKPESIMQARCGWPDPEKPVEYNQAITHWLVTVVKEVWQCRYGHDVRWRKHKEAEQPHSEPDSGSSVGNADPDEDDEGRPDGDPAGAADAAVPAPPCEDRPAPRRRELSTDEGQGAPAKKLRGSERRRRPRQAPAAQDEDAAAHPKRCRRREGEPGGTRAAQPGYRRQEERIGPSRPRAEALERAPPHKRHRTRPHREDPEGRRSRRRSAPEGVAQRPAEGRGPPLAEEPAPEQRRKRRRRRLCPEEDEEEGEEDEAAAASHAHTPSQPARA